MQKCKISNMAREILSSGFHSSLTQDTTVTGSISVASDIRIDGVLDGNLDCRGKVVIGEKGRVTGTIVAVNAEIMGEVKGNIKVEEKLVLKSTSVLEGDIEVSVLAVEPHAQINGRCTMQRVQPQPADNEE